MWRHDNQEYRDGSGRERLRAGHWQKMGQGTKNTLKNNSITSYIKKTDIQTKTIWKGDLERKRIPSDQENKINGERREGYTSAQLSK